MFVGDYRKKVATKNIKSTVTSTSTLSRDKILNLDALNKQRELGNNFLGCLSHHFLCRLITERFLALIFLL